MNIADLWIGDRLHVKSIDETGKFNGTTAEGNLIIKLKIGTVEVTTDDVTLAENEDKPVDEIIEVPKEISKPKIPFKNEIDLHMEALVPNPSDIQNALFFQVSECRKFVQQAIQQKAPFVTIIHGNGSGILKNEIAELLDEFDQSIFAKQPTNEGGAVLVYFKM